MARREIALAEYKQEQREAAGLFVDTGEGGVFCFDPPFLWPEGFTEVAETNDPRLILSAVLGGEDQLDRFVSAGGSLAIGMKLLREHLGLDVVPSPASSTTSTDDGARLRPTSDASTSSTSSTPAPLISLGGGSPATSDNSPSNRRRSGRTTPRKQVGA